MSELMDKAFVEALEKYYKKKQIPLEDLNLVVKYIDGFFSWDDAQRKGVVILPKLGKKKKKCLYIDFIEIKDRKVKLIDRREIELGPLTVHHLKSIFKFLEAWQKQANLAEEESKDLSYIS